MNIKTLKSSTKLAMTVFVALIVHFCIIYFVVFDKDDESDIITISLDAEYSDTSSATQLPTEEETTPEKTQPEPVSEPSVPENEMTNEEKLSEDKQPETDPTPEEPIDIEKEDIEKPKPDETTKKDPTPTPAEKNKPSSKPVPKEADKMGPKKPIRPMQATELGDERFNNYKNALKKHLEQFTEYPRRAKNRNLEGVVKIKITIGPIRGTMEKMEIIESSGYEILDEAAKISANNANSYPAIPKEFNMKYFEYTARLVFDVDETKVSIKDNED